MDLLRTFQGDYHTKEAVLNFICEHIDHTALQMMYKGEDVSHIKDARSLIRGAFEMLDERYEISPVPHANTNQAK